MKKNLVLFILFILPLVAYLFFATGVDNFIKLPVITPKIAECKNIKSAKGKPVKFSGKITILVFPGPNADARKGNFFNLEEKIFKKYRAFKDFQVVIIQPYGSEPQTAVVESKLAAITEDLSNWYFAFGSPNEIQSIYNSMKLLKPENPVTGTTIVYIVDRERNLRGRKGQIDKEDNEYREGYNTSKVSELHNEMNDDVRILLAEYRLALKKNSADRKKYGL